MTLVKIFELLYDKDAWGVHYNFDIVASHKWGLPGVTCPLCRQSWGAVGFAYPSVDLSQLSDDRPYRKFNNVPLEVYENLKSAITHLVPKGSILEPGTDFGPLIGTAKGNFSDFVWAKPWTLLTQQSVLDQLQEHGVKMPKAIPAILKLKGKETREFFELEIEAHTKIAASAYNFKIPAPCAACGRQDLKKPEKIIIENASVPRHVDIFRGIDFPTLLLSTERFVRAVKDLRLSNILFQPVDIV
jgi:uncharacterized double-CXXCG motif protein